MNLLFAIFLLGLVSCLLVVVEGEHQSADDQRQRRLSMLDVKKDHGHSVLNRARRQIWLFMPHGRYMTSSNMGGAYNPWGSSLTWNNNGGYK
ncbi:hypothetical protein AAVH_33015 [Aphelenchoides avenae]|nr:hypothetical protein AAVH_33015 [Aphelenchus avenae]